MEDVDDAEEVVVLLGVASFPSSFAEVVVAGVEPLEVADEDTAVLLLLVACEKTPEAIMSAAAAVGMRLKMRIMMSTGSSEVVWEFPGGGGIDGKGDAQEVHVRFWTFLSQFEDRMDCAQPPRAYPHYRLWSAQVGCIKFPAPEFYKSNLRTKPKTQNRLAFMVC